MDISDQCRPGVGYTYGAQTCIWYIHGTSCDNQRYPWYISNHWYILGISVVDAKTRNLINGVKIPDGRLPAAGASAGVGNLKVDLLQ